MIRLLFLVFLFGFTGSALAEEAPSAPVPIGLFAEVEGTATVTRAGGNSGSAATVDAPLYLNDKIETGKGAKVLVELVDGTEIVLSEDSELTLDSYAYDPEGATPNQARYSVLRGAFLYTSGLISKAAENPDIQIETPYGSIGVRGTQFWGGLIDGEYGVLVNEGEVYVANQAGRATLTRGMGVMLKGRREPPGMIRRWSEQKISRATAMVTLKNPASVQQRRDARKAALRQKLEEQQHRLDERPVPGSGKTGKIEPPRKMRPLPERGQRKQRAE